MSARILLVDDEKSIRVTGREFIRELEYEVDIAEDAKSALVMLDRARYDVVISDIILPKITGLELLRRIKEKSQETEVILITGEPAMDTAAEAVREGAFDYIPKPISKRVIQTVVQKAVRVKLLADDRRRLLMENRQYQEGLETLVEERSQSLRKSEEKYRGLFEHAVDMIHVMDVDGRLVDVNRAEVQALGFAREELIGKLVLDFVHPDCHDTVQACLVKTREGKIMNSIECCLVGNRGEKVFVEAVTIPILEEGKVTGMHSTLRDVTRQREAQLALKNSEANLKKAESISKVGHWVLEQGSNELNWSDEVYRILDLETETELKERSSFSNWIHHEDRSRVALAFGGLVENAIPYEIEYRLQIGEGTIKHVQETTHLDSNASGDSIRFLGTISDISRSHKTEEQLRKLSKTVEQSPVIVMITNLEGHIEYVNPKFTEVTGYSQEEIMGMHTRVLKSGENQKNDYKELWSSVSGGKEWKGELHNQKKNGELFWVSAVISEIKNADGQPTHYLAIEEDITLRKAIDEERRSLESQLRQAQKLETIGTLAGGIAHDFNNILAAILACAQMSLQDTEGNEDVQENLNQILHAVQRASTLVKQMLTFSRIDDTSLELQPLFPHLVVEEVFGLVRASLPSTIKISQHYFSKDAAILADPTQVHQVIMNLCSNAKHAIEGESGEITITVCKVDPALDTLPTSLRNKRCLKLSISDTGCGMEKEVLSRIFDPFYTTKMVGEGTGLGLSVVHGIVHSQNGELEVESIPGEGTTFHIYWPIVEDEVEALPVIGERIKTGDERILLVDDDVDWGSVGKRMIQRMGYCVTYCSRSTEARDLVCVEKRHFDLVITDQTMPDLTGVQLAKDLLMQCPDLPVLIMSGLKDKELLGNYRNFGISDYLQKPLEADELFTKIRNAIDENKARDFGGC